MKKARVVVLAALALVLVLGSAYLIFRPPRFPVPGASMLGQGINVQVSASKSSRPNEPFTINAVFDLVDRAAVPEFHAAIYLPSGAVFLDGDWRYSGPAQKGKPVKLAARVALVEEGVWRFIASAEGGGPKWWQGIVRGAGSLDLKITSAGSSGSTDTGRMRPPPNPPPRTATEQTSYSIALEGRMVGSELVNNSDQQFFLVIHDRAGIQELRNLGLVPKQAWGPWGPFYTNSNQPDILHLNFNQVFLVAVFDKKRPTTGGRVVIETADYAAPPLKSRGYGTGLTVKVRVEGPPQGISPPALPVSPYDIVVMNKDKFKPGQPVDVRFLVNGKLEKELSAVIRKQGQGTLSLSRLYPVKSEYNNAYEKARQTVATKQNVPAARLVRGQGSGGFGEHPVGLGIHLNPIMFNDGVGGNSYIVFLDPYGRVLEKRDVDLMIQAHRRVKFGLAYDGIDPPLNEMLKGKGEQEAVPVEIWFLANRPGATYIEVGQPLVQALAVQGVKAQAAGNVPVVRASMTKAAIAQTARRDDVAVIIAGR